MKSKYKATRNLLLYVVILLIMAASSAYPQAVLAAPDDLFVSTVGSGLNCTQADPCDISTALLSAQDNDHIYFAAGTYTSTSTAVLTLTDDISLHGGWDGSTAVPIVLNPQLYPTILNGEKARWVVDISAGAAPVLDGLTLTNGYGVFSGGGVHSQISHPTIKNCIIQDNRADGDGGGIFLNGGSAQILNNRILNNSANWSAGLRIINNAQVTLQGNTISGNTADTAYGGVDIDCCGGSTVYVKGNWIVNNSGGVWGGGVAVSFTSAVLENNIIAGNTASEGAGVFLEGSETYPAGIQMVNNTLSGLSSSEHAVWAEQYATADLTNNILSSFAVGILDNDPGSNTITPDHNLFWSTSDPLLGTNAIQADPLLDGDYHLISSSPARNAGTVVPLSIDIDGDPRPNGAYDLGADEYSPKIFLPLVSGPD